MRPPRHPEHREIPAVAYSPLGSGRTILSPQTSTSIGAETGIKNHCRSAQPMSQLGHKRTNHRGPKSKFVCYCPKADKRECGRIVRFVPLATKDTANRKTTSQRPLQLGTTCSK